jgi:cytochrome c553
MMMRKLLASVALLTTAGLAAGGIVDGMNASTPCQACHGADGIGVSDEIPNLAGQKAVYLQAQLEAFKSGDRKHDVMGPIARQLSDADAANLAAFWNSLPVGGTQKEAAAAALAARRPQMTFPADFPAAYVNYYTQEDAPKAGVVMFRSCCATATGATVSSTRRRSAAKKTITRCASRATRASRPTASCSRSAS